MKSSISQARINQEIRNMLKQSIPYLKATPLENDIYTWHFTIQGPQNSDFHQGLYHGQILLPFEYPFKPPDIVFMNKNGRFQTNTKICLTITQYHPEEWNSAWTIRTMLQAVMSLFNENVQGIGYEEGSPEQRRLLAKKSHDFKCDKCGTLKDLLKPRQPKTEQEKKQQPKVEQPIQGIATQKLEYASDLNGRKTKTEDNREFIQKDITETKPSKLQQKQLKQESHVKKQSKKQQKQNQKIKTQQKHESNQNDWHSQMKMRCQIDDVVALDYKIQKNYVSWARMLKSQKWSVIE